ncbi:riboflavin synthase [Helicobacter zhangjianzhongii]|uniref:riboflavin synthase n=1 Tax=Helicobacter zhangjianzhongii TaxID=2974574 RepID=UPI0025551913|nr:riboflavin synthase [Helicobacter sp. CPD2-1]MDL0080804.1 riboflavin synthase [Helicobacter sp. CPD2-1]
MFSGLVREIAKVRALENNILRLESTYTPQIGDSIAVNGMCLTVIALHSDGFSLEISKHSAQSVAMENYTKCVHIEPALRADSRLDGHFVQGHIDSIGTVTAINPHANQTLFTIAADEPTLQLAIPQGSITIDGISLTISSVQRDSFTLTLIPHTMQNTLFASYRVGRRVNIETDVLVRSVAHILAKMSNAESMRAFAANALNTKPKPSWSELDDIALRY